MSTSEIRSDNARDVAYFRQRQQNRVHSRLVSFFANEVERTGISRNELAVRMGKDPAQITRLLSKPSNLTLDTISDFLLAMGAEAEPPKIVRFEDRARRNYVHPLVARATGIECTRTALPEVKLSSQFKSARLTTLAETGSR